MRTRDHDNAPRLRVLGPLLLASFCGCLTYPALAPEDRPARWAEALTEPGVPNLHRVDEGLYRSAQPDEEGFRNLHRRGIRTVVNLRRNGTDGERLAGLPLKEVRIPVAVWEPTEDQLVRFLRTACDPARRPVLVHCRHGADRTGLFCAAYRVAAQGWTRKEAADELKRGGFGYHIFWSHLPGVVRRLDPARLRRKAGLDRNE
jgi:protein tyrosine phosphatase (PTP) superfamily phosphohydrolase (DUF442 family)